MKPTGYISRSIVSLLLTVMVYMYACSALCAVGSSVCCGGDHEENEKSSKSCCEHKADDSHKDYDCQELHSSFFNATGQFSLDKEPPVKVFQNITAVVSHLFIVLPTMESGQTSIPASDSSPPYLSDIRIRISSFQI